MLTYSWTISSSTRRVPHENVRPTIQDLLPGTMGTLALRRIPYISYLKAHAAEIVRTLGVQREPLIITQNGEAKVVVQDIDSGGR